MKIEPAEPEWAEPIVFALKQDETLRFCVDYGKHNAVTKQDSYPIPRMDECINSLDKTAIFSTLVSNSGYWKVGIDETEETNLISRPITDFNG